MKTNTLIYSIALLFSITLIFSCSKDIENAELNQITMADFEQLIQQYIPENHEHLKYTEEEIKEIIKADIDGAKTGTKMGSPFGPWGMFWGGTLVGAANSYAHSGPAPSPHGGGGWVNDCEYKDALSFHNYPVNPFNIIGTKHNELLVFLADQQANGALSGPQNWNDIIDASIPFVLATDPHTSFLFNDPSFMNMLYNSQAMMGMQLLSPNGEAIYSSYMSAIDFISSSSDYYQFTTNYEDLVLHATLSSEEKEVVLSALAVSRNSHAFWNSLEAVCVEEPEVGIFFRNLFCNAPGSFICLFPPTFPNPLPLDFAAGNMVATNNGLTLNLTETNLSQQTISEIVNTGAIQVANPLVLDHSIVAQAYIDAGLSPLASPLVLDPGFYDVTIIGDPFNASKIDIQIQTRVDDSGKRRWKIRITTK